MAGKAAPVHLCQRLGHAQFVDFGQIARKNKWNWFKVEARAHLAQVDKQKPSKTSDSVHVEDVQIFRSRVKQSAEPQLRVQIGISLTKRTEADLKPMRSMKADSLRFKELESCVKECEAHGVRRLGATAQQLIDEAIEFVAAKRAETR